MAISRMLCSLCGVNPRMRNKYMCTSCEYAMMLEQKRRAREQAHIRNARLAGVKPNVQKLTAVNTFNESNAKSVKPYEVSFVTSGAITFTEAYSDESRAWARFEKLKGWNAAGLRISVRSNKGVKVLSRHQGTRKLHVGSFAE